MEILEHISLKEKTTLKIGGEARYFCSVSTVPELLEAVSFAREKKLPLVVLGGGVVIEAGAIVIQGASDPEATAEAVIRAIERRLRAPGRLRAAVQAVARG